jgi:hypothetical protein
VKSVRNENSKNKNQTTVDSISRQDQTEEIISEMEDKIDEVLHTNSQ